MPAGTDNRTGDTLAFWLIVLFTVVMYAIPSEWIPALAPLRLALVSSSLAAALMVARRLGRNGRIVLDGLRGAALLAFFGLLAASEAWSIEPALTRALTIEMAKSVAIYFAMVNLVQSRRRLVVLCAALVLSSIVTSVGVINWYRAGVDLVEGFRARWLGTYADPNRMAMSLGIAVPLAVAYAARRQSGWLLRIACAAAAGLAVTAMVLSHSRGGFIGLAASLLLWTVRERKLAQTLLVAALGIGMLVFAPASFWKRNEGMTAFESDASAMGRVNAWTVAARANAEKPLLGTGGDTFPALWVRYAPPDAHRALAAHNVFIQVMAELGWIGFLLFLIFVGGGMSGPLEASAHEEVGWLSRAIAASFAGYLVCSFFAGFLASPHFYVVIGLGACAERIARASRTPALGPVLGPSPALTS